MPKKSVTSFVVVSVALLLLWGILTTGAQIKKKDATEEGEKPEPAPASRYEERLRAIRTELANERARLGLDREALAEKYPTPEITLCPITRVVPGGSAELVTRGNFSPGTKFLIGDDRDNMEVVKEAITPTGYRATVKAAPDAPPGMVGLEAFALSGITSGCTAVYIGGKYEWDFSADNGWRIKLKMLNEGFTAKQEAQIKPVYCAEFYRGDETKPFEARGVEVSYDGRTYHGDIQGYDCDTADRWAKVKERREQRMAEMQRQQEQQMAAVERYKDSPEVKKQAQEGTEQAERFMKSKELQELKKLEGVDPDKLSEKERAELMARLMQLAMEQAKGGEEEEEAEEEPAPKKVEKQPRAKAQPPAPVEIPEEAEDPIAAKMADPEFMAESIRRKNEFCPHMTLWLKKGEVEGTMGCGEERVVRQLKGTVKYTGQ